MSRSQHGFSARRNSCATLLSRKWFAELRNRKVASMAGGCRGEWYEVRVERHAKTTA